MDTNEITLIPLEPEVRLLLTKVNAKTYLNSIKQRVKDTGFGLFEFVEVLKFFEKIKDIISGDSQAKNPEDREGDKEFKKMVIDAITLHGKEGYTTPRGAKFALMEAGTKYHYENCNDPILKELVEKSTILLEEIKARQEFLKVVSTAGLEVLDRSTGEMVTIYPPYKTSTSTYKVTLPK